MELVSRFKVARHLRPRFKTLNKLKKKLDRKASLNIAIGTIVMVIIGMVILTSGIVLMKSFISGAEEIKASLDSQTEAELERLLIDQGQKVALPLHTANLEAGEDHIFGIGILNIDADTYGDKFKIEVTLSKVIDEDNLEISVDEADVLSWLLYDQTELTIADNEHKSEIIYIEVPETAAKGTYIFNVYVYYGSGSYEAKYDSVKKMYVTVE